MTYIRIKTPSRFKGRGVFKKLVSSLPVLKRKATEQIVLAIQISLILQCVKKYIYIKICYNVSKTAFIRSCIFRAILSGQYSSQLSRLVSQSSLVKMPVKVDLPANSTFFTRIRVLVHTGKIFTDDTEISRHVFSTFKKLGNVFANLGK